MSPAVLLDYKHGVSSRLGEPTGISKGFAKASEVPSEDGYLYENEQEDYVYRGCGGQHVHYAERQVAVEDKEEIFNASALSLVNQLVLLFGDSDEHNKLDKTVRLIKLKVGEVG